MKQALDDVGRLVAELGEHGAMEAAEAGAGPCGVERGDVGEADERCGANVGGVEPAEQAHDAVAAAGAEDGAGREGAVELGEAAGVVSSEVAMGREEAFGELWLVAGREHLEAGVEAFAIEGTCGGDDGDLVVGPQRRHWAERHGGT